MIPTRPATKARQLLRRKATAEKCIAAGGTVREVRGRYTFYEFPDGSCLAVPNVKEAAAQ